MGNKSTIKLTSIAVLERSKDTKKPNVTPAPLYGIDNVVPNSVGSFDLTIGSVPLMRGQKAPDSTIGLLMLYGYRDIIEEIQGRRTECRHTNGEFRFAEIEYEVGNIEPGLVDREKLRTLRFANVKRMTSELQTEILDFFVRKIGAENVVEVEGMKRVKEIAKRPDLFGALLEEDKDFANIEILVIPVLGTVESSEIVRQVALVRPSAVALKLSQNAVEGDSMLVLPQAYRILEPA